jgi:hypothetical protein
MRKSFDLSSITASLGRANWREPGTLIRAAVAALAVVNLFAAAFAFHVFGASPEQAREDLASLQAAIRNQRTTLERTRHIVNKVETGRAQGDEFVVAYMTPRRTTYSTILQELEQTEEAAGMTPRETTLAPLDPVKGSADISKMTVTASFEGNYQSLVKLINLLDRSRRFLIIESLAAAPQPTGPKLNATIKINTFVRQDTGDSL